MSGPCRLRNIEFQIIEDSDTVVSAGFGSSGEIVLGNPFLISSGLNGKDFLADNIQSLSAIDYNELHQEEQTLRVGKLGFTLLSQKVLTADFPEADPPTELAILSSEKTPLSVITEVRFAKNSPRLCIMVSNGSFPLKDEDDVDYKDAEISKQDEESLAEATNAMLDCEER